MEEIKLNFDCRGLDLTSMLEHGVHFGHRRGARNPMMNPYIYKEYHGLHIIDVRESVRATAEALNEIYNATKQGKHILFVSTKGEFRSIIEDLARVTSSSYTCKWRGGMLTNWKTVIASVKSLRSYNDMLEKSTDADSAFSSLTKKELLGIKRKRDKLHNSFAGITGTMPDLLVTLSVSDDKLAIAEANNVGIPVIGIVDTNASTMDISYPIPGNDNSEKVIRYYCELFAQAAIAGMSEMHNAKQDSEEEKKPAASADTASAASEQSADETVETFPTTAD